MPNRFEPSLSSHPKTENEKDALEVFLLGRTIAGNEMEKESLICEAEHLETEAQRGRQLVEEMISRIAGMRKLLLQRVHKELKAKVNKADKDRCTNGEIV